jgi:hypothetical protein
MADSAYFYPKRSVFSSHTDICFECANKKKTKQSTIARLPIKKPCEARLRIKMVGVTGIGPVTSSV